MNRFLKQAESRIVERNNWFSKLDAKTQAEILDAAKKWKGPITKLAEAIKSELNLSVSVQQIFRRIKDEKAQIK